MHVYSHETTDPVREPEAIVLWSPPAVRTRVRVVAWPTSWAPLR
ncbi:hypothetical protein BJ999_004971 [Actinomadura citrea]|uniref:Uncharacterized protein n=1 Tax=Actinomadura citrea TaxID=46158 RepID=A0A7Y9GG56_9ACTN|nr:hypothetical protein [Actinomadura citrea]